MKKSINLQNCCWLFVHLVVELHGAPQLGESSKENLNLGIGSGVNTYGRFVVSALSLVPKRTHPKKNGDHLNLLCNCHSDVIISYQ